MCQSVNHGYTRERSRASFEECVSLSTMDTKEREQELVSRNVSVCQPWMQKRENKSVLSKRICLPPLHYPPTWMWQEQEREDSNMEEDQEARVKRWRAILQTEQLFTDSDRHSKVSGKMVQWQANWWWLKMLIKQYVDRVSGLQDVIKSCTLSMDTVPSEFVQILKEPLVHCIQH